MQLFCCSQLTLHRDIREGQPESLLSLFNVVERIKPMDVLADAEEGEVVHVVVGDIAEADLALGADMRAGRQKTLMTLFWYRERSSPMTIKHAATSGDNVRIEMYNVNG